MAPNPYRERSARRFSPAANFSNDGPKSGRVRPISGRSGPLKRSSIAKRNRKGWAGVTEHYRRACDAGGA
jgi:hypothetical protein